jgi:hypothetical protein
MVDYAWELVTLRLLWVMKHTFFFALLEIPEGYDNLIEKRRNFALDTGQDTANRPIMHPFAH